MVPGYPRPVVQALQRQVDVFVSLQLDHRQPAFARGREYIDHGAVRSGKCGYLGIQAGSIKTLVHFGYILDHQRFQPALRMQSPERMISRTLGMTDFSDAVNQKTELGCVVLDQHSFVRAYSKPDLG